MLLRALTFFAVISMTTSSVMAASYTVSGDPLDSPDYSTIQAAITAASNGDTITVYEGTYTENISIGGKAITLTSTDPNDSAVVAATIIDGDASGTVVLFDGTETAATVLTGFTITNGWNSFEYRDASDTGLGGGVSVSDPNNPTEATISKCVIAENGADYGGGLAYCDGAISNCTISGNETLYDGGGLIYCDGVISNCTITGNSLLVGSANGGGLAYCDAAITGCTISANDTYENGGGFFACDGSITGCTIIANEAEGLYDCDGSITNCLVIGNDSDGLSACDGSITGCLVAGNYEAGFYNCPGISQCTVVGNAGTMYWEGQAGCGGGVAVLNTDLTLSNSLIAGNVGFFEGAGGGIGIMGTSGTVDAEILNCTIAHNLAYCNNGGGLWVGTGSDGTVDVAVNRCILYGNRSQQNGLGDWLGHQLAAFTANGGDPSIAVATTDMEVFEDYAVAPWDDFPGDVDTFNSDPDFTDGPTGTWSSDAIYDPNTYQLTFTDSAANWTANELVGMFVDATADASSTDPRVWIQLPIIANTATTITVWADARTIADPNTVWAESGDSYQVYDYHLEYNALLVDAGGAGSYANQTDIDGQDRVMGSAVDIGADEYGWSPLYADVFVQNDPNDFVDMADFDDPNLVVTLCKKTSNQFKIVFNDTITLPDPNDADPISIKQITDIDPETLGSDLAGDFSFTRETTTVTNDTLVATESYDPNDPALAHLTWYRIQPTSSFLVGDFDIDLCLVIGDANADGRVMALDLSVIWAHNGYTGNTRWDINGDGQVMSLDQGVAWGYNGSVAPAKPNP